ncbi:MAG TPA: hypothetical protein VGL39_24910 [Jatrophihabitantaceae bacterium]|jgi:hypothetical protein
MTPPTTNPSTQTILARHRAAALFAAAARSEQAGPGAQLHCLAAVTALHAPTGPVPAAIDALDPDQLIQAALRLLAGLDLDDFSHPEVLTASRHGRRALLEPRP